MIHGLPIFRAAGDAMMEAEPGNEMSFGPDFIAHSRAAAMREVRIDGFVELVTVIPTRCKN
ncbi:MAG: hypothetical protein OXD29_04850 [Roseovarius sp.]|nr:hypothetical protein [Roseovarius sp.]MCY4291060.1 hypothetical protein [Roseovarius sp.]MCY4315879.1 hypothetical protein [Roseovarius sp.]